MSETEAETIRHLKAQLRVAEQHAFNADANKATTERKLAAATYELARIREYELHKEAGVYNDYVTVCTELDTLERQRDEVLALCSQMPCSNCKHSHGDQPCSVDLVPGRADWGCNCDWGPPQIVTDIRAIYAGPETAVASEAEGGAR